MIADKLREQGDGDWTLRDALWPDLLALVEEIGDFMPTVGTSWLGLEEVLWYDSDKAEAVRAALTTIAQRLEGEDV